jgi:hypothetical protein
MSQKRDLFIHPVGTIRELPRHEYVTRPDGALKLDRRSATMAAFYRKQHTPFVLLPGMDPSDRHFVYSIHHSKLPMISPNKDQNCWLHAILNHLMSSTLDAFQALMFQIPKKPLPQTPLLNAIKKAYNEHVNMESTTWPNFTGIHQALSAHQLKVKRMTGHEVDAAMLQGLDAREAWELLTDIIHDEIMLLYQLIGHPICDLQHPCLVCNLKIHRTHMFECAECGDNLKPVVTIIPDEDKSKRTTMRKPSAIKANTQQSSKPKGKQRAVVVAEQETVHLYGCDVPVHLTKNIKLFEPFGATGQFFILDHFLGMTGDIRDEFSIRCAVQCSSFFFLCFVSLLIAYNVNPFFYFFFSATHTICSRRPKRQNSN